MMAAATLCHGWHPTRAMNDADCLVDKNGRAFYGVIGPAIIAGQALGLKLRHVAEKHGFNMLSVYVIANILRKKGHKIAFDGRGGDPWLRRVVLANAKLRNPLPPMVLAERWGTTAGSVSSVIVKLRREGHDIPRFNKRRAKV